MRVAPKAATTTAPNAAECQSFLDNLVADLDLIRALDYRHGAKQPYPKFESHSLRQHLD
jgi:hypothetical protein